MIDQYGRVYARFRVDTEKDWAGWPCIYTIYDRLTYEIIPMDSGRHLTYTEPGCIGVQDMCDDWNARYDCNDITDYLWQKYYEETDYETGYQKRLIHQEIDVCE